MFYLSAECLEVLQGDRSLWSEVWGQVWSELWGQSSSAGLRSSHSRFCWGQLIEIAVISCSLYVMRLGSIVDGQMRGQLV